MEQLTFHFKMFLRSKKRMSSLRTTYQSSRIKIVELARLGAFSSETMFERPDLIPERLSTALDQMQRCLPQSWSFLSRVDLSYILASTAAHNLKPYGKGCPSQEFSELLKSECLDCSNYGLLTYYISRLLLSEEDRKPLSFVGWDGGAIGNHQMLFLSEHEKTPHLAIDPTLGIACIATFDEIASGKPIPPNAIAIIGAREQLSASRLAFVTALLRGQFRPSQLLYYFPTGEDYLTRYGNPFDWPTPAISILRDRHSGK
ncbi:hypothetical protein AB7M49_005942 [Bradyrhizobium elkanii]|uniref:hypothetical protein n=1 Tax=Bradyrhizobium TaxID=374 RepID=UPI0020A17D26|nr:hypothetical protein [Bradyrhizobium elkanii]MCP1968288.1 hypothetical protein [Bradyrhizobium elkanii]MCS4110211.1 hypothetical protein [Bradyrhizobium elkanii]